jgi:hypothetical protein
MIEANERVCPQCGMPPGEQRWCAHCGMDIAQLTQLPTRAEFEDWKTPSTARADQRPSGTLLAGWYSDPGGSGDLRWWDGQNWTEHASTDARDQGSAPPSSLFNQTPSPPPFGAPPALTGLAGYPLEGRNGPPLNTSSLRVRDRRIGQAGWIATACLTLNVAGSLLVLISDLMHHAITALDVSDGFRLAAQPLVFLAALWVALAFVGPRQRRSRNLLIAAVACGVSSLAQCVSLGIRGGLYVSHHDPGTVTASLTAAAAAQAVIAMAFLVGAGAFTGHGAAGLEMPHRRGRLGTAAVIYAVGAAVKIAAVFLLLVFESDTHSSSTAATLTLASCVFSVPVAILFADAFYRSSSSARIGAGSSSRLREQLLAGGFTGLTVTYLLLGIGDLIGVSQNHLDPGESVSVSV